VILRLFEIGDVDTITDETTVLMDAFLVEVLAVV
jgi:hypothetical protein